MWSYLLPIKQDWCDREERRRKQGIHLNNSILVERWVTPIGRKCQHGVSNMLSYSSLFKMLLPCEATYHTTSLLLMCKRSPVPQRLCMHHQYTQ